MLGAPGALGGPHNPLARIALSLGLRATATGAQIIEVVAAARGKPGIAPVSVPAQDAPCKQNIARGGDIDLEQFPAPIIHGPDGGRYIQTYGMNIVKTPDGSWTNWSVNRMMIAGKDRLACLIPPFQHLGMIRTQWARLGQPMPIVMATGVEPGLPFVGGMPLPEGADESHFLGALFGESIEVTPAETVDLPVPATAEIVIEGHIAVDETAMEGPMNEYPGYNARQGSPKAVFHVSAVTWRDQAILPVVAAGPPVEEDHTVDRRHARGRARFMSSARPACPSPQRGSTSSRPSTGWSCTRSAATGPTPTLALPSWRRPSATSPSLARPVPASPRCCSSRTISTSPTSTSGMGVRHPLSP